MNVTDLMDLPAGAQVVDADSDVWTVSVGGLLSTWGSGRLYRWDEPEDSADIGANAPYRRVGVTLPDAEADGYAWPEGAGESIAAEAERLVHGDRDDDYGHPRRNFTRIAHMWTALLSDKLAEGAFIDTDDVARCQVATKLSRDVSSPKRDNRVDGIGYFIAMDRMETGR